MSPLGFYIEDYVHGITEFIIEHLPVEVILFDRGFDSWGVIYKLKKLHVNFLIFWKKRGDWYNEHFKNLDEGEFLHIKREGIYNRDKTNCKASSSFVLIKQLEYEGKRYDWIFATNLQKNTATSYVKRYKKRWGHRNHIPYYR